MSIKQPLVVRAFFKTVQELEKAHEQLEAIGVFGDTVSNNPTPGEHRLIFTDSSLTQAKVALRRISVKPELVQVFDPQSDWDNGFQKVSLT